MLLQHLRECHLTADGNPRRSNLTEAHFLNLTEILRPAPPPPPTADAVDGKPALCLGARQVGAAVPSLSELEGCVHMLHNLLKFAHSPCLVAGPAP